MTTVPPGGIASRALMTRFRSACWIWTASARTWLGAAAKRITQLDVLADQPADHRLHAGDDLVDVDHPRLEQLPPSERQQLLGQRGGLIRRPS